MKSGVRHMGEMGVWVEKSNTLSYETKMTEKGLPGYSMSMFKFFSLFFCFRREAERQSPRWGVSLGGVPRVRVFDEAGEKNRLEPEHKIPFGGFSARA